jgi:beta-N-acetylhexosaminidase
MAATIGAPDGVQAAGEMLCNRNNTVRNRMTNAQDPATPTPDPLADLSPAQRAWVQQAWQSLDPRQRLLQCECRQLPETSQAEIPELIRRLRDDPPGSVFIGGEIIKDAVGDPNGIRRLTEAMAEGLAIPPLVAADLERGTGCAIRGLTELPHQLALGCADDEALAYDFGKATAIEAVGVGITWTFAPVVDLIQNWLNPAVMTRGLGGDAERVARLATAVARGMQDHGLAACAKHFPGDGADFHDQHLVTSVNHLDEATWFAQHGKVFSRLADAGVWTMMAGHIALPWCDPPGRDGRQRPATVSLRQLTGLLRGRMGFRGAVVSDALIMAGIAGWAPPEQAEVESFVAGVDVMLWPEPGWIGRMEAAMASGVLTAARRDEAVLRALALKARVLLPTTPPPVVADPGAFARGVATQIAERGIATVRNRENLLPWNPATTKRVLLLANVNPAAPASDERRYATVVEALRARGCEVTVLRNPNCLDIPKREAAGERWDAFLALFSLEMHEQKNSARPVGGMAEGLWSLQMARTVRPVVASLGSPFMLYELPGLGTLVNTHSSTPASQRALVAALFGEIPGNGRSPVRYEHAADLPPVGFIGGPA